MRWPGCLWARFVDWVRALRSIGFVSEESHREPEAQLPLPTPPPPRYRVVHLTEDPDEVLPETLYAIGENGHLWHVLLLCPCGCGASIGLNLLPDASPRWRFYENTDGPTLVPSVWRITGCRSHFVLRRGRILWCADDRRSG